MLDKLVIYGMSGLVARRVVANQIKTNMSSYDTKIERPRRKVTIIMTSYKDDKYIARSAKSIRDQSIIKKYPHDFEFLLIDSSPTFECVRLANPYIDSVVRLGRGKLTARNVGAILAEGDILVSTDADTIYPKHWLNTLLKPFKNKNVVGVCGTTIDHTLPDTLQDWVYILDSIGRICIYPNKMSGRNSAYYKEAFNSVGRFNENINQLDGDEMLAEEEYGFGKRLSKLGDVIHQTNASCIHLGGQRGVCRNLGPILNISPILNIKSCDDYKLGTDRF